MRIVLASLGFLCVAAALIYQLAPLAAFNLLVPKDAGVTQVAADVSYGGYPRQRLDLYRPEGAGPFPVLLFVYGGSWDSGHKEDYAFAARAFAAEGYLAAVADYRLVPDVHYPAFVDDVGSVIDWLAGNAGAYQGDGRKVFVVGHSAGAYNMVQAVVRNGLGVKVTAMASLAGPFDFLPLDSPKSIAAFADAPDLRETQPVNGNLRDAPPLLLLHGRDDTTVGLHNSWNLNAAFARAGRESKLIFYEGIGHVGIMLALAKPLRGRAPVLRDVVTFFQRYR